MVCGCTRVQQNMYWDCLAGFISYFAYYFSGVVLFLPSLCTIYCEQRVLTGRISVSIRIIKILHF